MTLQNTINHPVSCFFPPVIDSLPLLVVFPAARRAYYRESNSRRAGILGPVRAHVAASFPRPVCPRIPCLSAGVTDKNRYAEQTRKRSRIYVVSLRAYAFFKILIFLSFPRNTGYICDWWVHFARWDLLRFSWIVHWIFAPFSPRLFVACAEWTRPVSDPPWSRFETSASCQIRSTRGRA